MAMQAKKISSVQGHPLIVRVYIMGSSIGKPLFLVDLLKSPYTHARTQTHHEIPEYNFYGLVA